MSKYNINETLSEDQRTHELIKNSVQMKGNNLQFQVSSHFLVPSELRIQERHNNKTRCRTLNQYQFSLILTVTLILISNNYQNTDRCLYAFLWVKIFVDNSIIGEKSCNTLPSKFITH
ncbi:hypothetical protein WN51_10314 [Melipona quadrifasciata]|uniref:Uncharacterized protein n=1 Tax=Melipona quadrifasciata TaxID=166423 RepID=A0A0N1ITU4_9HYME|nr:hypothetical protein WN51_10314 [Melipona quadrifasciata]